MMLSRSSSDSGPALEPSGASRRTMRRLLRDVGLQVGIGAGLAVLVRVENLKSPVVKSRGCRLAVPQREHLPGAIALSRCRSRRDRKRRASETWPCRPRRRRLQKAVLGITLPMAKGGSIIIVVVKNRVSLLGFSPKSLVAPNSRRRIVGCGARRLNGSRNSESSSWVQRKVAFLRLEASTPAPHPLRQHPNADTGAPSDTGRGRSCVPRSCPCPRCRGGSRASSPTNPRRKAAAVDMPASRRPNSSRSATLLRIAFS